MFQTEILMTKKSLSIEDLAEFEALWSQFKDAYPRRHSVAACVFSEGKKVALSLVKNHGLEIMKDLITSASNYARECRAIEQDGTKFVKQVPTFLRSDRWQDYLNVEDIAEEAKPKKRQYQTVDLDEVITQRASFLPADFDVQ